MVGVGWPLACLCLPFRDVSTVAGMRVGVVCVVHMCATCRAAQGQRKIGFSDFKRALELVAAEKGVAVEIVEKAITTSNGPIVASRA